VNLGPSRSRQLWQADGSAHYGACLVDLLRLRYTSSGITFYNPSVSLFRSPFPTPVQAKPTLPSRVSSSKTGSRSGPAASSRSVRCRRSPPGGTKLRWPHTAHTAEPRRPTHSSVRRVPPPWCPPSRHAIPPAVPVSSATGSSVPRSASPRCHRQTVPAAFCESGWRRFATAPGSDSRPSLPGSMPPPRIP